MTVDDRSRHVEEKATPAERSVRPSRIVGAIVIGASVVGLGVASSSNPLIAIVAVLLVGGLALLINARPVVWIALAFAVPWTSRLLTSTGLAPRFFDFLDFPLTIVAVATAGAAYLRGRDRIPQEHRKICHRLLLVALVMAISWAFNDAHEPQRLLAALALALEPFLLLVAVILAPLGRRDRRMLVTLTVGLLSIQLPFSLLQIAAGARIDFVKGTLLGTEAGHHVSPGGMALGFFLLLGLRVRKTVLVLYGAGALFVMAVADAKQVLFLLPLALVVLGFTHRRTKSTISAIGGIVAGTIMASAAGVAVLAYQGSDLAFEFIERSVTDRTGKIAVAPALWEDLQGSPATFVFGLGPGQSVSRFAFLTSPDGVRAGSPMTVLDLDASRGIERYIEIADVRPQAGVNTDVSSFNSPQSSVLGIVGDYGLAGALAFAALIWAVISAIRSSADRGLRSAALSGWALLLPLALIFDWLEQPPFTLALMLVSGMALRSSTVSLAESSDSASSPSNTSPS